MKRTICILDDDRQVVTLAEKVASKAGHDAHGFRDARSAQSFLLTKKCDIIILDLIMPDVSGLDFTVWLREFSPFTRIINVTANAPVSELLGCWRKGADACVLKGRTFIPSLKTAIDTSCSILANWETTFDELRKTYSVDLASKLARDRDVEVSGSG